MIIIWLYLGLLALMLALMFGLPLLGLLIKFIYERF